MIELKPCLCGNPAELVDRVGGWSAGCIWHPILEVSGECLPCRYDGPYALFFASPEEAATYWNENRDAICKSFLDGNVADPFEIAEVE